MSALFDLGASLFRSNTKLDCVRLCLVPKTKILTLSHQIFEHMYKVLNVGKKPITQIACKLQVESFKPNCAMI